MDVRADVLVGHVRLYHDGMYLDCDSARFYKDENTFNAYGNVKMMQGDTLTLTSDTLLYDGPMMQAHALGNAVLTHRNTQLTTDVIDYDRWEGIGFYPKHGVLVDGENVLNSDYGQYTPALNEAVFKDNVVLDNPKFNLKTNELQYYSDTKVAKIVSETNIVSSDSTFVYALRGEYNTQTGQASLMDRSHIYKEMRDIVGDSLFCDEESGVSEAFGNVILLDVENRCMLTGDYCRYEN
jgi:lipopolysaccharide export system protein LptA